MMENKLLTQDSLGSRRAAHPTPTTKTINSRVPRWKRNRFMASPRNKVTDFVLPIMLLRIDSLFLGGGFQAK